LGLGGVVTWFLFCCCWFWVGGGVVGFEFG
jgi:hypothetical protein